MPPREDKLLLLLGTLLTDTLCSKEKEKLEYGSKITFNHQMHFKIVVN